MAESESEHDIAGDNERQPYDAPELVDCGDVAKVIRTGASNPGGDGIYS